MPNFEPRNICSEHIKNINGVEKGTDCAEARDRERRVVEDAEQYLGDCEAMLSSADAEALKFERLGIAKIADDANLPEQVTQRAARLLSRIR